MLSYFVSINPSNICLSSIASVSFGEIFKISFVTSSANENSSKTLNEKKQQNRIYMESK